MYHNNFSMFFSKRTTLYYQLFTKLLVVLYRKIDLGASFGFIEKKVGKSIKGQREG